MKLEYNVIYSDRKTLAISVERDRSVIVRAPIGMPPEKIKAAVETKKFWLYQKTKHSQKYDKSMLSREFVSGTSILYLGKHYRLDVTKEPFDGILFNGKFVISQSMLPFAAEALKSWYIERAKQKIIPKAEGYAKNLGVEFNRIMISDLKYRWGSCTPKNNLNVNWRLIKAPMGAIEYVIVHELAHLLETNHTKRFWSIIRTQLPTYHKSKEWLKQYGSLLEEQV